MESEFTVEQKGELDRAARCHRDAHMRSRAMAVRAVALGHSRQDVARVLPFSAYSIGQWVQAYQRRGLPAFRIAAGRGRRSRVDEAEVLSRLRRSPEQFGIEQTRWTLRALGQACPSLAGMSERGILEVLHRLGFHYKRGQPWIHSPDPRYEEKKTPSKRPTRRPKPTGRR
jgi:transposase